MDKLTPEQRHRNMQANKNKGTSIEMLLGRAMWHSGLRHRKNVTSIYGKPDFVFRKYRLAVFCDGEFWHGRDWLHRKNDHKSNTAFWYQKIERNIERDKEVNQFLKNEGWTVLRFWESDIKKNLSECLDAIMKEIDKTQVCDG